MRQAKSILKHFRPIHSRPGSEGRETSALPTKHATLGQALRRKRPSLSKFEKLPFDVQYLILLALNSFKDLRALVHASPTYHEAYLEGSPATVLWNSLRMDMGPALIDAYTAYRSHSPQLQEERTEENVVKFVHDDQERRATATTFLKTAPDLNEVVGIAHFYSSTILLLLPYYLPWAGKHYPDLRLRKLEQLSKTERTRILRACYRFETWCNLFGVVRPGMDKRPGGKETVQLFLGGYEPWEVEEILCINTFAEDKYDTILDEVQEDVMESERYKAWMSPFSPAGIHAVHLFPEHVWYQVPPPNKKIRSGLALLCDSFREHNYMKWAQIGSKTIWRIGTVWILSETDLEAHRKRREKRYSDRDRAQDERDVMLFRGDRADAPSLAWTTIWQDTYSNIYGYCVPDELRYMGWIMWDADHLRGSGAREVLVNTWYAQHGRLAGDLDDPRAIYTLPTFTPQPQ